MAAVGMGSVTVMAPAAAMTTGLAAIAPSTRKGAAKPVPTRAPQCKSDFCLAAECSNDTLQALSHV